MESVQEVARGAVGLQTQCASDCGCGVRVVGDMFCDSKVSAICSIGEDEGPDILSSCVLLFLSINNVEYGPGPKSKHSRERDAAAGVPGSDPESQLSEKEKSIDEPAPARVHDAQTDQTPGSTAAAEDIPHEGAR